MLFRSVDAAFQIVDTLLRAPKGKTIAFVKNKAISAGALIALACSELAMREATTIGDCAPITYSNDGPKMMGEKFQSPLRAKFRSLAKRNGYPEALAESMVTKEMTVYKIVIGDSVMFLDSIEYADLPQYSRERISTKKDGGRAGRAVDNGRPGSAGAGILSDECTVD